MEEQPNHRMNPTRLSPRVASALLHLVWIVTWRYTLRSRRAGYAGIGRQSLGGTHQARRLPALLLPGWPGSLVGAGRG